MGWWIALGVLTLLAIAPVGVSAVYNSDGPVVRVLIGPLGLQVFPQKPRKEKKQEKPKKKKVKAAPAKKQPKQENKKGGSLADFLPLVQLALDFLNDFRKKLRVKRLEMKLIMAADDPSDLAVNYGKAWAALGNLMPLLERVFVIRKRDLEVECDFTASETVIYARLDITITLGRMIGLALRYGVSALCEYFKIMNQRKGGAKV